MKRRSIYLGLIPLTIIFIWEGIEFGYRDAFKSAVLTCSGVLLVIFVYGILNRLKCRAYEEPYAGLGADSLHEFLSGKRGIARQLWGIWILFTLPFALFDSSTSKLHFWGFIMPITLIGTMWLYFAGDWESLKCDESDKDNQPGKLSKLWFTLILSSLLYQSIHFGVFQAIRTVIGVSLGVLVVWMICTTGRRLEPDKHTYWLVLHLMGYYYTSGAKGSVRQLFDLFIWYSIFGILLNYPLANRSVEFSLSIFIFVAGLIGITIPWVRDKCQGATSP